jgi:hypothetical protein
MVAVGFLLQIHTVRHFSLSVLDANVIYMHNKNTEQIIIKFGSGGSAVELTEYLILFSKGSIRVYTLRSLAQK